MLSSISSIFTANRIAAISTWLAGLAGLILAVEGTFPHSWQNAALAVASLLTKAVVGLKFLDGSQKFDAIAARQSLLAPSTPPSAEGVTGVTGAEKDPTGAPTF